MKSISAACFLLALPVDAQVPNATSHAIPFDQLGAEAQKQYTGAGISIIPTKDGAKLKAVMQDIEAEATSDGLWLTSTSDEDVGTPNRFRVRAAAVGRESSTDASVCFVLRSTGKVRATKDSAIFLRPGVIEDYTVNTDGIRQDFVLPQRLPGKGKLTVELEITGARAEATAYGAKLTVMATGRELAYSRLKATDATGKELPAHMEVTAADKLRIVLTDASAVYPVRIDPTFSDADWISMGSLEGTDGTVSVMVLDGSGNLYIGGDFTVVHDVVANCIAKWNGSSWSSLGSGISGTDPTFRPNVAALVVSGNEIVAGGRFSIAGGVSASCIARWNGTSWSALGSGISGGGDPFTGPKISALALNGSNLYVGGKFNRAGGLGGGRINRQMERQRLVCSRFWCVWRDCLASCKWRRSLCGR